MSTGSRLKRFQFRWICVFFHRPGSEPLAFGQKGKTCCKECYVGLRTSQDRIKYLQVCQESVSSKTVQQETVTCNFVIEALGDSLT